MFGPINFSTAYGGVGTSGGMQTTHGPASTPSPSPSPEPVYIPAVNVAQPHVAAPPILNGGIAINPSTAYGGAGTSGGANSDFTQADTKNVKCFEAGLAKKQYIQYVNNKLAFNSEVSSSGNGCVSDRPTGFVVERGKPADTGLVADGDCYDESGINVSNEPTHVLYNSKSRKRLINDNSCLSYNADGSFRKVAQTPTFDFASGWSFEDNMLITNRDINKAIRVNGELLELAVVDNKSGNLEFLWEREGGEFRNLKTNKCMNIGQMKVTPCVGSVRHTRWDYVDNKLLKNRRTERCLDSNGTSVYMSGCGINNPFQHWSIEDNGGIVKHVSSGKCLSQKENNFKTQFEMVDCKCEGIVPGEASEKSYLDYIDNFAGACRVDDWGYDKIGTACLHLASQNSNLMDRFMSWCDKNQKNESVNKYCIEFMKYNDLLQYYSRMCSEDNGVGEKPLCIKVAIDSDTLILDDKARDFIKIKWDDAMYRSCEKGMTFTKADKDAKKFSWKYTTDSLDDQCLDNWTFRDTSSGSPVDIMIQKTTSLGDSGYWCPTINGDKDFRLNCATHTKTLNFLKTESTYMSYNNVWKAEGANTDLPFRLYKAFISRKDNSVDAWRVHIRNEFKVSNTNKDRIHFAYFALFYGGFPIRVNQNTPFRVRFYSLNGKNYIYKESNYDVIQAPYRDYFAIIDGVKKKIANTSNYYYLLVTDAGVVNGIKADGTKEIITPVSPFQNKNIMEAIASITDNYYVIFILFLIVVVVAVCSTNVFRVFRNNSKVSKFQ